MRCGTRLRFSIFLFAIALCGIPLFGPTATAQTVPVILPGQTLDFYNPVVERVVPDDIDGKVEFFAADAAIGTTPDVLPLSSFVQTSGAIGRANSTIFQYNDITVDPGDGGETVVTAQISGEVFIRGYMLLISWGLAEANVGFEVIDITDTLIDPNNDPNTIATHTIASYELRPGFSVSMSTGLGAIIGTATAGAGKADLSLGVGVPLSKRVIRDHKKFGFTVLLRRGHTYRLQLTSSNAVKVGRNAGLARISLWAPLASVPPFISDADILTIPPSLVDPQVWLAGLDLPMLDKRLPSYSFPDRGIFAWDWWDDFDDTNDILAKFGIPTKVRGLVNRFFDRVIPDEEVTQPGVDLRKMEIALATDQVELLNMISDQVEELKEIILRHPPFQRPPQGVPFNGGTREDTRIQYGPEIP